MLTCFTRNNLDFLKVPNKNDIGLSRREIENCCRIWFFGDLVKYCPTNADNHVDNSEYSWRKCVQCPLKQKRNSGM